MDSLSEKMEFLPPELMALIFSFSNPKVLAQFRATSSYYHQILPKHNYTIYTPTVDEVYAIIRHLSTKVPDSSHSQSISFAIKKPTKEVLEESPNIISELCKVKNIASLDLTELNLKKGSAVECLAQLTNLEELTITTMPNALFVLSRLTKLIIRRTIFDPPNVRFLTNLRELCVESMGNSPSAVLGMCKVISRPELLTKLHIKAGYTEQFSLHGIMRLTNLVDLFLTCSMFDSFYGAPQPNDLPLIMTGLRSLHTNANVKPELLAANIHLTRLVLHDRINSTNFRELSKLIYLRELSLVAPKKPLDAADLEFMSNNALSSLTMLSACSTYEFLDHVQADSLKELYIDLLPNQLSLEALSRLPGLESLNLEIYPPSRSPKGLARSFNVANLTLLTRLVTPKAFAVKSLECLPSLLELVTVSPIDAQSLVNATRLTKLETAQIQPEAYLPPSLEELVAQTEPSALSTLTNLTRLELGGVKTCSWVTLLTKLKRLEIMNFISKADLDLFSALTNLTCLSVGYTEELSSTGYPFILLTKLQSLQLSGTSEQALQFIMSKLPRLLV
jgi:hypothetical protein